MHKVTLGSNSSSQDSVQMCVANKPNSDSEMLQLHCVVQQNMLAGCMQVIWRWLPEDDVSPGNNIISEPS